MTDYQDTIAAIATPIGSGGIGIVRVSGEQAIDVAAKLFQAYNHTPAAAMTSHLLYYGLVRGASGELLDEALCTVMRAPHSYTREDVVEFQLHGGPAVVQSLLGAVLKSGARLATPGEFTLRAYLNGRIDLSQAEAVMDVIEAKTPRSLSQATGQLEGRLRRQIDRFEQRLNDIYGGIIVGVDFPDDADAAEDTATVQAIRSIRTEMEALLETAHDGRICREGVRAALVGAVNVGKSSLMNLLLHSERAIVTAHPGTTRDVIEESVDINGLPLLLSDTAGFRDESGQEKVDEVERIGIRRSTAMLEAAALILLVVDGSEGLDFTTQDLLSQTEDKPRLAIINKCDVADPSWCRSYLGKYLPSEDIISLSAKTGEGLEQLKAAIVRKCCAGLDGEADSAMITNARQEQALTRAIAALDQAMAGMEGGVPLDIAAIDLENALTALGAISGKTASEAVLDNIFSRFCLGK